MTYKELIEECKKRGFTIIDDNGKFSVLDKKYILTENNYVDVLPDVRQFAISTRWLRDEINIHNS